MSIDPEALRAFVFVLFVGVVLLTYVKYQSTLSKQKYEAFEDMDSCMTTCSSCMSDDLDVDQTQKPKLYWFCDSNINSRNWGDFGARNSKKPNRGYLAVALDRVYHTQYDFTIVPLIGREDVLALLPDLHPDAKKLPTKIWREFVIANILKEKGGLVMDGDSTLCIGPSFYPLVQNVPAATFGINPDEPTVSPTTALTPGPSPYVGWSKMPNHPAWSYAASVYNALVARGAQSWSSSLARRMNQTIWEGQQLMNCVVLRTPEGGRLATGKKRELEDIFGRKADPADPRMDILPNTVYICYDGEDLERRYEFNWFLRLSPKQIQQSNLVWTKLAGF